MFGGRCVKCKRIASVVHEMVPRSCGSDTMKPENRVPLCNSCHSWAHRVGTNVSAPILMELREKFLQMITPCNDD